MKKVLLSLVIATLVLTACGNPFPQVNEAVNEVKSVAETAEAALEKAREIADKIAENTTVKKETAEEENIKEEIEETEETETPEGQNEFFEVLDALKNVHPGTAGSSLKVASAAYKFLNNCRVKLPFDLMASEWVKKQDKSKFSDINESFTFVYESLDQFKDSSMVKGLLSDVGVSLPDGVSFDGIIDEAKKVLQVVIDATK